jgi:hypothetical protein
VQRKVFRIEAMMAGKRPVAAAYAEHRSRAQGNVPAHEQLCARDGDNSGQGLQTELMLIRDALASNRSRSSTTAPRRSPPRSRTTTNAA